MPTFANTINDNQILAKRSQCDYAGNDIQTTYATKTEVTTGLASKQDTISDLSTIRSGAAAGATAVQPGSLSTVATSGSYNDLSNRPTIPTVDQTYNASSTNAQSGTAVAGAISGINQVPASTSSDADKVLKVNSSGTPEWAAGGGDDGADWDAEQGEPGYIENKPVPKTLTAGTGISITENQSTITIANTATPPTVDQTYDASSTNAQSGTAVAEALASLGTDRTVIMNTPQASSTSQMTLTEPFSNFEYIEIYATWDYNTVQRIQAFARFPGNQTVFNVSGFGCANQAQSNYGFFFVTLDCSVSGTTITVNRALRALADNTLTSNTDSLIVQKIVGVHRIASN